MQYKSVSLFTCLLLLYFQLEIIFGKGNILDSDSTLDLFVYISSDYTFNDFDDYNFLLWHERNIKYSDNTGDVYDAVPQLPALDEVDLGSAAATAYAEISVPSPHREKARNISKSKYEFFKKNTSIYAHIYFCKASMAPNPKDPSKYDKNTIYRRHELTSFRLQRNKRKKINLFQSIVMTSNNMDVKSNVQQERLDRSDDGIGNMVNIGRYWKPQISIHLIKNIPPFSRKDMPLGLRELGILFHRNGKFYPPIYVNEFWLMSHTFILLDSDKHGQAFTSNNVRCEKVNTLHNDIVPLTMYYETMDYYKWYFQAQMEASWAIQRTLGTQRMYEQDETKRIFIETNPKILILAFVVSVLHTVFDFLAFKNDIIFWKKKKSVAGLSVKSIIFNCFFQLIIVLYLFDNDTATVLLFSNFIGLLVESWKLTKLFRINYTILLSFGNRFRIYIPVINTTYENDQKYAKSNTKQYENIAIQHLSAVVYPLLFGYAAYSFIYLKHKNLYSWIINVLVGFIYAFGFILMTPQLFINYKLKSVAHLPWRKMMYKFLNTFIDDLFAFIIKMPTLHRLSCLRDDIVFFIFIYQRFIYTVDISRLNEFEEKNK
eukprot:g5343.t1